MPSKVDLAIGNQIANVNRNAGNTTYGFLLWGSPSIGIKRIYYLTDLMFRTTSADRHPIKSAIAGHGCDVWTRATLTLDIPWYCLSYSSTSEATIGLSGTELLSKPDQIAEFLSDTDANIRIDQLLLVSPPRLNGTQQWLMEPLAEVWQGRLGNSFFNVPVYVLQNGRRYVGAPNCDDWQALQELRLLVQFSSPGSASP
jgi:hypothetical protein